MTISLTWLSRLMLWGLQRVLDGCIWLDYWMDLDLSGWAANFTEGVINDLQFNVETAVGTDTDDAKHD